MKLKLTFAELHTPLFLGGKNLGLKLSNTPLTNLDLVYDQIEKELWVTYNGKIGIIPTSNVVSMTPHTVSLIKNDEELCGVEVEKPKEPKPLHPMKRPKKIQGHDYSDAQVSTPTSHVFGEGPGKTGQEHD